MFDLIRRLIEILVPFSSGYRQLIDGQRVTFEAEIGAKGRQTKRVRPL